MSLEALVPDEERFEDDGTFPNSKLPVLIYRDVLKDSTPEAFEALFKRNDWPPQWRAGIFNYHHYHSTAHECLGVAMGDARLMLGGPEGREFAMKAGDVIVLPAGVAHKKIMSSPDFLVVGAYPPGEENWDILRGEPGDRPKADRNIEKLGVPGSDPVSGKGGALVKAWA